MPKFSRSLRASKTWWKDHKFITSLHGCCEPESNYTMTTESGAFYFSILKSRNLWINVDSSSGTNVRFTNFSADNFETLASNDRLEDKNGTPTKNFSVTPHSTQNPSVTNVPKKKKLSNFWGILCNSEYFFSLNLWNLVSCTVH